MGSSNVTNVLKQWLLKCCQTPPVEESTVSQLDVLLEERPRLIMGFLKKKWLKLMSKRKTKVNVSIMSTMLIVQLTFQIPFRYSFPFLLPPISPQPGHSGHGRVSAPLPNRPLSQFHTFRRDPHFRRDSRPVAGHQGGGADSSSRDTARLVS